MSFIKLSFVFMAFLFSFGDTATVPTPPTIPIPGHCSVITSQTIKLSIFDLEDVQIKSVLYLNVNEFKNQTVGQFLDYLENVQHISLSSHTVSARSLNPLKDVSPFTTIPLTTPLCEAIDVSYDLLNDDRQYTLFVGVKLTPRQALVRRFSRGLVIDDHTGLFKMGILSPIIFDKTYQPVEDPPMPSVVIEKHIIETVHTKTSTASRQNGFSEINEISAYIISMKAEHSNEKSSTSKNSIKTRNAVVSLLNKKTGFYVEENKIDLDPSFVEKLYSIVDDKNLPSYNRTKRVVKLFNRYGWYVTNQFSLGGRLDVVKSLHESSASNEMKALETLETKLSAAFNASVGASSKKGSSSVDKKPHFSYDERITSTVDGATDIASFMKHVEIKENWRIIALDNTVPTLKFLLRNHSNLFAEIRRLIISNVHHLSISNLQPHINMLQLVNNIWDNYVQPF